MPSSLYNEGPDVTLVAGETFPAYRRGKIDTAGKVVFADIADVGEVVSMEDVALDKPGKFKLLGNGGILLGVASEAVDIGDILYSANDGKISDTAAGAVVVGRAMQAAAADGDIFEYIPKTTAT